MPRMPDKPSPEQMLASLLTSSGATSFLDPKFARYLDASDPLGYMRHNFTFPSRESMQRQPEPEQVAQPKEEVMREHRELRDAKAGVKSKASDNGEAGKHSGQPAKPQSTAEANRAGPSSQQAALSSDESSDDERTPDEVYQSLKRSSHGDGRGGQAATNGDASGVAAVPAHLQSEQHDAIVYLAGNSLGLQSRLSCQRVAEEMSTWAEKAVSGWFSSVHNRPWKTYAEKLSPMVAGLVGAKEAEVASMGNLTANLHLLLCSFYRPTEKRFKILFEAKAFPSDHYAFASQVEMHGRKKEDGLITVKPRKGEYTLHTEDILKIIEEQGDEVAVVFFSGVNYFSGQVFEMERITAAAHAKGCLVGWDLAHGIGNIPLKLHDWGADFAVWCTYKYLNSGPGGIAGLFVHEKHSNRPRLSGWWGNNIDTRFAMAETFDPAPGAAGFQTSTPSIISLASLLGSLETILQCGKEEEAQQENPASTSVSLKKMRRKSMQITSYMHALLKSSRYYVPLAQVEEYESRVGDAWKDASGRQFKPGYTVITPDNPEHRGSQLSILLLPRNIGMLPPTMEALEAAGVYGDEREPDVIRFAPVPLYVSYKDVWQAVQTLDWAIKAAAVKVQGRERKPKQRANASLH